MAHSDNRLFSPAHAMTMSPMPKRPKPSTSRSEPVAGVTRNLLRSAPRKTKKIPIFSLLFNHQRTARKGLEKLKSAKETVKQVESLLDNDVKEEFNRRMEEPVKLSLLCTTKLNKSPDFWTWRTHSMNGMDAGLGSFTYTY
jgi:hypothetical protein